MTAKILTSHEVVFHTPWFDLVAKHYGDEAHPHYSITTKDYVCIVATNAEGRLILIRQFRPALDWRVLELPSGHVEPGQTPEEAARIELLEETGCRADQMIALGALAPDPGRLGNKMYCFFAPHAIPVPAEDHTPEPGIELMIYDKSPRSLLLSEPDFCSALNHTAVSLAILKGHLAL